MKSMSCYMGDFLAELWTPNNLCLQFLPKIIP